MKKFLTVLFAACLSLSFFANVNAADSDALFRIGLSSLGSADTITLPDKTLSFGYQSGEGFAESITLTANDTFYIKKTDKFYIRTERNFNDYSSAKVAADAYISQGYQALPCLVGDYAWAVYIGGYDTESQAYNAAASVSGNTEVAILSGRGVELLDGTTSLLLFDNKNAYPQAIDPIDGIINLGVRQYRWMIEFSRTSSGIMPVNVISPDEYLCGTVPSEMPSSWNLEALKAQAVASRSYAMTRKGIHSAQGYDLCDAAHCQVYIGASNEAETVNEAVRQTAGEIAWYNGEPINAVYSSSSGGVTENSENVWVDSVPYLRSVTDEYETTGREWSRVFSLADINSLLSKNAVNIGQATGVQIGSFADSGRVNELIINGTAGSKSLFKEDIRTFFSSSAGGSLESRNFQLSNSLSQRNYTAVSVASSSAGSSSELRGLYAISSNSAPVALGSSVQVSAMSSGQITNLVIATTDVIKQAASDQIVIAGKGWGHGAGMSQHGANGMAAAGFNYRQILEHYYTGIEIY